MLVSLRLGQAGLDCGETVPVTCYIYVDINSALWLDQTVWIVGKQWLSHVA